ncbi:unnamed protein product [Arabis nemorensis]|uniref:Uncharacterized protein n=1 Tax=Arabis nemorensis TaxID=586526 RepID=A0A565CAU3_9BRAS|nr:unnamed protein product [Arabis nemorensis]
MVARISELEKTMDERGTKLSALTQKLDDNEKQSSSTIESLTAGIDGLRAGLDSMTSQKEELEKLMASKGDEASMQIKSLEDEISGLS